MSARTLCPGDRVMKRLPMRVYSVDENPAIADVRYARLYRDQRCLIMYKFTE